MIEKFTDKMVNWMDKDLWCSVFHIYKKNLKCVVHLFLVLFNLIYLKEII